MEIKTCTACKIEKNVSEFYKIRGGKFGVMGKCKPCHYAISKIWASRNKDQRNKQRKKYWDANPQRARDATNAWRRNNKAYDAFRQRLRHALKRKAVPKWADLEKIKIIYENCPQGFHVDHIIPLKGKIVTGLHVENNLQYLPALENIRKKNYYEIDMD